MVSPDPLDQVPGTWPWTGRYGPVAGWSSRATARPPASRRTRTARPRTWSRRWRTASAQPKKMVEVVCLITSDPTAALPPGPWTRGHQEIENKLHWVRDVTYQEDTSRSEPGTRSA